MTLEKGKIDNIVRFVSDKATDITAAENETKHSFSQETITKDVSKSLLFYREKFNK